MVVKNEPGGPARVIGLFSERGYTIERPTVAEIDHTGHRRRITILSSGMPHIIERNQARPGRIIPVHKVHDPTVAGSAVEREPGLFKAAGTGAAAAFARAFSVAGWTAARSQAAAALAARRWATIYGGAL